MGPYQKCGMARFGKFFALKKAQGAHDEGFHHGKF